MKRTTDSAWRSPLCGLVWLTLALLVSMVHADVRIAWGEPAGFTLDGAPLGTASTGGFAQLIATTAPAPAPFDPTRTDGVAAGETVVATAPVPAGPDNPFDVFAADHVAPAGSALNFYVRVFDGPSLARSSRYHQSPLLTGIDVFAPLPPQSLTSSGLPIGSLLPPPVELALAPSRPTRWPTASTSWGCSSSR